jgi:hypothetical protein
MYAKIFSQIYDSSIAENYHTRLVFMDLLVLADLDGVVDMTVEAIARRTNVPLKVLMSALSALEAPDPCSRSENERGARIVRLDEHRDWGWRIVNFKAYHAIRDENARRENNRRYQQEHRERLKACQHPSAPVSTNKPPSAHTDTDTDTDTDKEETASVESPADAGSRPEKPKVITWTPIVGFENITDQDLADWSVAYPACDLGRQLAAMTQWLKANPTKAQKKAWRRFVTGWLTRSQERGGDAKSTPAKPPDDGYDFERMKRESAERVYGKKATP